MASPLCQALDCSLGPSQIPGILTQDVIRQAPLMSANDESATSTEPQNTIGYRVPIEGPEIMHVPRSVTVAEQSGSLCLPNRSAFTIESGYRKRLTW